MRRAGKIARYQRRSKVLTLAAAGYDPAHIAALITEEARKAGERGTTAGAVRKIIETQLEKWAQDAPPEDVDRMRALALERLDQMTAALWSKVKDGNPRAIDTALRIEERRARIMGLEKPVQHEHSHRHEHELVERAEVDRAHEAWLTAGADVTLDEGDIIEDTTPALMAASERVPVPSD